MMLRELSGALATMADGPHDERRNSLELLNNILEVLSRDNVVRTPTSCLHVHARTHARTHTHTHTHTDTHYHRHTHTYSH